MLWILPFALGVAGTILTLMRFYYAHHRRRRSTEHLIADLKADEVALERKENSA